MGMTPLEFYESFVLGNYHDCDAHPGCVRRAFNAAVSAAHLADHYHAYNERNNPALIAQFSTLGKFVEHVSAATQGAFRDIRSISNAYKHLYTDTNPRDAARSSISSTGAIEEIQFPALDGSVDGIAEDFVPMDGADALESKVIYRRKDGQSLEFLVSLRSVVEFWDALMG